MVARFPALLRCLAVALLAMLAAGRACALSGEPVFNNPLVLQRADPQVVLQDDGNYYFTATVPEYDRIELRRARTLDALGAATPQVVWRKHDKGEMGAHIWAPELHRIHGKWYIYFTAGRAEAIWDIRLYVLENSSPDPFQGEWIERGQLKTGWESFSLDATTFELHGQRYLVWTQRGTDESTKGTNIYIAKMDTPWSITGKPAMLTKPEYPWERVRFDVNEAPAVLLRNGRVFLTYSASATDANYVLGMLTASENANLLDPAAWRKSPEPVLRSSAANGQYGPGHNSFTTTPDGKTDILVYHARNYRDIKGDSLYDPNRHTRAQAIRWRADGTPDFGEPVPDGAGAVAAKPLFRDPVFDGAADPVVIWNPQVGRWWMFYTNRRANVAGLADIAWVHGTRIGIAESADNGASWRYLGTASIDLPADMGGADVTHWAPDIVRAADGTWHMFLTVVPGIFNDWKHPRQIVRLTSKDLRNWGSAQQLALAAPKVIDASVVRLPEGGWRMWYNNEADKKSIYFADSPDLVRWTDRGRTVGDQAGEGPKVFQWKGSWWMITDVWQGLGVYRSSDALNWKRQADNLLQQPGKGEDDRAIGGHPDVVVSGERAFLFYFTHPDGKGTRRTSIQVVELSTDGQTLRADRDAATRIKLIPQ
jgi:GH43 family beta-xylosidase